ncbi:MAG: hypothetical protein M1812_003937 [Candelaria pacifica]|nr:MAG: hypothetical protein M1812_003937 [Candelaria pacifica]
MPKKTRKSRLKPFPFMQLPPELRCNVYRHLLVWPVGILVPNRCRNWPSLVLLAVSRIINVEATSIFYSENRFYWFFGSVGKPTIPASLRIDPRFVPLLKSVAINFFGDGHTLGQEGMQGLPAEFSGPGVKLTDFTFCWYTHENIILRSNSVIKALKTLKGIKHFSLDLPTGARLEVGLEQELEINFEKTGTVEGRMFEIAYHDMQSSDTGLLSGDDASEDYSDDSESQELQSQGFEDEEDYCDMIAGIRAGYRPGFEHVLESESDEGGRSRPLKAGQDVEVAGTGETKKEEEDESGAEDQQSEVEEKAEDTDGGNADKGEEMRKVMETTKLRRPRRTRILSA